jgi:hypothetical protein
LVHPAAKHGSSIDNNEDSTNSPFFRAGSFTIPTTTRTSATFTFPSYMEEPIIVYPGAIVCFLQIISCIPKMIDEQVGIKKIELFFFFSMEDFSIQIVYNIF